MIIHTDFDERDKDYYAETHKTEVSHKLNFNKADAENHRKSIKKLRGEIEEEEQYVSACEREIARIESELKDSDGSAKKLLFRDFKAMISDLVNGQEAQDNCRYGFKIQHHGPLTIEKPIAVSDGNGRSHTEMVSASVTKFRDNGEALTNFRKYLEEGRNLPIESLTFDGLKIVITKFCRNIPDPNVYGEEYETVR